MSDTTTDILSTETIDDVLVKIVNQLSSAIETGVEKIPVVAEFLLTQLSMYYYANILSWIVFSLLGVVMLIIGFKIWNSAIQKINNEEDKTSGDTTAFLFVASGIVSVIGALIIFISTIGVVNTIPKAVSPIGHIIHQKVIK